MLPVGEKSNEITCMAPLLKLLDTENRTVTIDAMGTQRNVVRQIVDQHGSYVLPVKDNQKGLRRDLKDHFSLLKREGRLLSEHTEYSKGHGRWEVRTAYVVSNEELDFEYEEFSSAGFTCLVQRRVEKIKTGDVTEEEVFYVSCSCGDARELLGIIRNHWSIESAHWWLDEHFREDRSIATTGFSLENLALLRRIAYDLIQLECRIKGIEPVAFDTHFSDPARLKAVLLNPLGTA